MAAAAAKGTCKFKKGEIVRCKNTGNIYLGTGTALRKFSTDGWKAVQAKRSGLKFRDASCSNIASCKMGEPATSSNLASNLMLIDAGPSAARPTAKPTTASGATGTGTTGPFTSTPATVAPTPIPSLNPLPPFGRFVSLTSVEANGRNTDINIDNSQKNTSNIGNLTGQMEQQNDMFNAVLLALLARKRGVAEPTGPTTPDGLVMLNPPASAATYAGILNGPVSESEMPTPSPSPFPLFLPEAITTPPAPVSKTLLYAMAGGTIVASAASAGFLYKDAIGVAALLGVMAIAFAATSTRA